MTIDVRVGFNGDSTAVSSWTNIGDDLQQIVFSRGRDNPATMWGAGSATFVLEDSDRDYDPLNTSSPYAGDLVPGKQVEIRVKNPDDVIVRTWKGIIRKWEPSYFGGDAVGRTTVTCVDRISMLVQPLPLFPNDWVGAQLSRGPGVFHIFSDDFVGTTTGKVTDLSGQGRDGFAITDWTTGARGAEMSVDGDALKMRDPDTFRPTIPPDPISGGQGWGFVCEFNLRDPEAFATGGFDYFPLFEDSWGNNSGENYWHLFLRRDQSDDTMRLVFEVNIAGGTLQVESDAVGDSADWIAKDRVAGVGVDQNEVTIFCTVPEGADGDIGGLDIRSKTSDYDFGGTNPPTDNTDAWNSRLGHRLGLGGTTNMNVYSMALFHTATSPATALQMAEAYRDYGTVVPNGFFRINRIIDALDMPNAFMTVEIANNIPYHPGANIGLGTALEFFQRSALMGQGRLYQDAAGAVILEDVDYLSGESVRTVQSGGTTISVSDGVVPNTTVKYSDQDGELVRWKADTARLFADYDDVINEMTVRMPDGHVAYASDATSISDVGLHSRAYDLPFALAADADSFAADMVARYKDPLVRVHLTVEPDDDDDQWDALADKDIGDQVDWERQPLATGPVITETMELEGEVWSWDAITGRFSVRLHFGPHRAPLT